MRIQNPQELFRFEKKIRSLQNVTAKTTIKSVKKEIQFIENFFEKNGYVISKRVHEKTLQPVVVSLKSSNGDEAIGVECAEKISHQLGRLFPTTQAESENQTLFAISEKRYATTKLLNDVPSLLGKDVFADLPEIVQYDTRQACKCIVFECPTSAAFHLMRACEGVIAALYKKLSGDSGIPGGGSWGDYEMKIKTLPNKPSDEYLEQSRHIRKNFRNPTQHPDKIYDIDEAQDLLSLTIDLINRTSRIK